MSTIHTNFIESGPLIETTNRMTSVALGRVCALTSAFAGASVFFGAIIVNGDNSGLPCDDDRCNTTRTALIAYGILLGVGALIILGAGNCWASRRGFIEPHLKNKVRIGNAVLAATATVGIGLNARSALRTF